jgi:hypothetical protein
MVATGGGPKRMRGDLWAVNDAEGMPVDGTAICNHSYWLMAAAHVYCGEPSAETFIARKRRVSRFLGLLV